MVKLRQVQVGFLPVIVKQLIRLGHEEHWETRGKVVKIAGTVRKCVELILRLRKHEAVDIYLKEKGGTLSALIETAVLKYIAEK